MRLIIQLLTISLLQTFFIQVCAQSDVSIGTSYKLNLQRQDDGADAFILHNAKTDVAPTAVYRWENTHPTFGSRGLLFNYISGIHFFADARPTVSGSTFTPSTRLFIGNDGKVGIGTITPNATLHVPGGNMILGGNQSLNPTNLNATLVLQSKDNNSTTYPFYIGQSTGSDIFWVNGSGNSYLFGKMGIGTTADANNLLQLHSGDNPSLAIGKSSQSTNGRSTLLFYAGTATTHNVFSLQYLKDSNTDRLGFFDGAIVERMTILNGGNVGIGTTNPSQKLEVKGTVYSTEVKVDVNAGTGPDYVFEPTYNLPTLAETEAYIKANKHLPEVPSAKEMEANGINLSEMNMLLLKKVEELTLHMIEQNKTIVKQNERIKILEEVIK